MYSVHMYVCSTVRRCESACAKKICNAGLHFAGPAEICLIWVGLDFKAIKSYQCHRRKHNFWWKTIFSIEIFAKKHCSSLFLCGGLGGPTWPLFFRQPFFDVPVHLLKYKAAEARPSSQRLPTIWRIFWKAPYFNPAVVFSSSLFKSEK